MAISDDLRVLHMLDYANDAIEFTTGRQRVDLDSDKLLPLALARIIEMFGEAAAGISGAWKERYPDFPWREAMSTRNRIVHRYFDVDLDILWRIATQEMPAVLPQLEAMATNASP
jgi:uncharacterized protein with HEPN domain